jgi:hypothetical protein
MFGSMCEGMRDMRSSWGVMGWGSGLVIGVGGMIAVDESDSRPKHVASSKKKQSD